MTVSLSISERGDPARAGTIHGGAQIMNATASHRGSGYTAAPAEAMLRSPNLTRARRGEERSAQAASLPWRFDACVSSPGLFKAGCMCGVAICIRRTRTAHRLLPRTSCLRLSSALVARMQPHPCQSPGHSASVGLLLPFVHSQLLVVGAVICCTVVWSAVCSYESLIFIVFLFMRRPPLACNPSHSRRPLQAPSSPQVHLTSQVCL